MRKKQRNIECSNTIWNKQILFWSEEQTDEQRLVQKDKFIFKV